MQRRKHKHVWAIGLILLLALTFAITQWDADEPAGSGDVSSPPMGEEGAPLTAGPALRAPEDQSHAPVDNEQVEPQAGAARIRFTVLDWTDDPVRGASVSINERTFVTDPGSGRPHSGWGPRVSGLTDAKGIVEFDAERVNPPGATATLQWRVEPPQNREDLLLAGPIENTDIGLIHNLVGTLHTGRIHVNDAI